MIHPTPRTVPVTAHRALGAAQRRDVGLGLLADRGISMEHRRTIKPLSTATAERERFADIGLGRPRRPAERDTTGDTHLKGWTT